VRVGKSDEELRMRSIRIVACAIVFIAAFPGTPGRAQSSDLQGMIVFAPNAIRTVTFVRRGVVVGSFEVPPGKWLRVSYDDSRSDNALPAHLLDGRGGARTGNRTRILDRTARVELHGNVTARVEIAQSLIAGAPVMPVAPSPVVSVSAEDVDVLITGRD
jgi:hypothetical protein